MALLVRLVTLLGFPSQRQRWFSAYGSNEVGNGLLRPTLAFSAWMAKGIPAAESRDVCAMTCDEPGKVGWMLTCMARMTCWIAAGNLTWLKLDFHMPRSWTQQFQSCRILHTYFRLSCRFDSFQFLGGCEALIIERWLPLRNCVTRSCAAIFVIPSASCWSELHQRRIVACSIRCWESPKTSRAMCFSFDDRFGTSCCLRVS